MSQWNSMNPFQGITIETEAVVMIQRPSSLSPLDWGFTHKTISSLTQVSHLFFFHKRHFRSKLITMAFFKKSTDTAVSIRRVKLRALFSQTKSTFQQTLNFTKEGCVSESYINRFGKRPCDCFFEILFTDFVPRENSEAKRRSEFPFRISSCLHEMFTFPEMPWKTPFTDHSTRVIFPLS